MDDDNDEPPMDKKILILITCTLLFGLYYFDIKYELLTNIIITTLCISLFDVFLKKHLLFNKKDEYYVFIVNNVITIICINLLFYLIKQDMQYINFTNFFNICFSCFFYELIIFKLYNYNKLHNSKLRKITKTILRLSTIHILTTFLNNSPYDKHWFDYSLGQILNISAFNSIFEN
jgi:FlaA1/EpsC-like NDP-sugar epimerase